MEEFLATLRNPYTLALIAVTAVGTLVSVVFYNVAGWILSKIRSGGGRALRSIPLGLKRPFTWCADGIGEWKRVSAYRHRIITWDDLPPDSQNSVGFQDLSPDSQNSVDFQDLSEPSRRSISFKDLPLDPKSMLLEKFILHKIYGSQHSGELHKIDELNRPVSSRAVQIAVNRGISHYDMRQDGMLIVIDVEFVLHGQEFAIQRDDKIWFSGDWQMAGKVRGETPMELGKYQLTLWIDMLHFEGLNIFDGSK